MFGQEQQSISIQRTEGTANVPIPLVNYIDQKIAVLDWNYDKGLRKLTTVLMKPEEYQQERAKLQKMKDDMLQGKYTSVASLLQTEQEQAKQELASLQQQFRPLSQNPSEETMQGDRIFRMYQARILREQGIL